MVATVSGNTIVEVSGVFGCTGVFFFGSGKTTGAHLEATREVAEVQATIIFCAAQYADNFSGQDSSPESEHGPYSASGDYHSSYKTNREQVKAAIAAIAPSARIANPQIYQDRPHTDGYWSFRATPGSTAIKSIWGRSERGSPSPPPPSGGRTPSPYKSPASSSSSRSGSGSRRSH